MRDIHTLPHVEPILVNPSPTSREQLGVKVPAMSRLKPPQLMEHLGFRTEVHARMGAPVGFQVYCSDLYNPVLATINCFVSLRSERPMTALR